jgi:hypothetical protein
MQRAPVLWEVGGSGAEESSSSFLAGFFGFN